MEKEIQCREGVDFSKYKSLCILIEANREKWGNTNLDTVVITNKK